MAVVVAAYHMFPIVQLTLPRALREEAFSHDAQKPQEPWVGVENRTVTSADESASVGSSVSDLEFVPSFRVKSWDKKSGYSDYIRDALQYLKRNDSNVIMVYEAPSTAASDSSFFNSAVYRFHDYPPAQSKTKAVLGPCRYSCMNGSTYPSFLAGGEAPEGLMAHWQATIPDFVAPTFVSQVTDDHQVYAYLPCEAIQTHVNDPHVHYHLAGKDAIPFMTKKTAKLLNSTKLQRPCIAKTTHSMGSKGIFVIRNDEDEVEFEAFLAESGNPTFVVTEFVEIARNVACHFFIHPDGSVTFFGSNENHIDPETGRFSMDSYLIMKDQEHLRSIQLPFVKDIADYCIKLGFFGFCGVDVLFDKDGKGYLVDVNPRVTGSCPSLMVAQLLQEKYGFQVGLFRRNGNITYYGSAEQLYAQVEAYNTEHEGQSKIVIFASMEVEEGMCKINIGVYGNSLEECKVVLNTFAKPKPQV